jgi:hypothetical protein
MVAEADCPAVTVPGVVVVGALTAKSFTLKPRLAKLRVSVPAVPVIVSVYELGGVLAVVAMVSVEVAPLADGVTEAGLNAQDAPAGRPEQASATAVLKPFSEFTVTVAVAL